MPAAGEIARATRSLDVTDMGTIFHITSRSQWEEAVHAGLYQAPSLLTEGFIHCSDSHQVVRVANGLFRNTHGLVLLHIDTGTLKAPVVYENLEGGAEKFPHVYGPINVQAVREVTPFTPGEARTFDHYVGSIGVR